MKDRSQGAADRVAWFFSTGQILWNSTSFIISWLPSLCIETGIGSGIGISPGYWSTDYFF